MYIEFDANAPVYTQIIEYFKREIFGGRLEPGQKLPTVRELSQQMGVNPNTLQKAMAEMERDGLVRVKRTAGRYVTTDVQLILFHRQQMISAIAARFLLDITQLGCTYEEICSIIDSCAPPQFSQPSVNADLDENDTYTGAGPYAPLVERYAEYAEAPQYQSDEYFPAAATIDDEGYSPLAYLPQLEQSPALSETPGPGYLGADYLIDDDFQVNPIVLDK